MPRKKAIPTPAPEPKVKKSKSGEATVIWGAGESRTYNKADHGADYLKMAQGFAKKKNGKVV